jgi:CheY-like chemotaxis protein
LEILIVEDNSADVLLIKEAIKISKIIKKCHVVKDGEEALRFLNREGEFSNANPPDVIILDLNLPRKNGFEVLEELKNGHPLQKIPVIIFTCSDNVDHIKKCYGLYANCYLTKPVELDEYENILKTIESFWGKVATLPSAN